MPSMTRVAEGSGSFSSIVLGTLVAVFVLAGTVGAAPEAPPDPLEDWATEAVSRTPEPCDRRVVFFSEFGDATHSYDGANGSVDRFASYYDGEPECVRSMYADGTIADSDNPLTAPGRYYPFALLNLPAFDPDRVDWGFLRWDVYYQHRGAYENDGIGVFDPRGCEFVSGALYNSSGLVARLAERGEDHEQWITFHLDLTTGWISAAGSDHFGRPVPGRQYGEFYRVPRAYLRKVLAVAAEGKLFGRAGDDLRLSYVAISGSAAPVLAAEPLAPEAFDGVRGHVQTGWPGAIATADNVYALVYGAPDGTEQAVEVVATYRVPEALRSSVCRAEVEFKGNTTYSSKPAVISILNPASGEYTTLGSKITLGEQDRTATVTAGDASGCIAADGTVKVRLRVAEPGNIPLVGQFRAFKVSIDVLRLNLRLAR